MYTYSLWGKIVQQFTQLLSHSPLPSPERRVARLVSHPVGSAKIPKECPALKNPVLLLPITVITTF